ncbi:MAG: hypothetical protein GW917_02975 [Bdellovibrionales bacterium]|nr:hypothetical protein [Bdellovibrionales bacterium]
MKHLSSFSFSSLLACSLLLFFSTEGFSAQVSKVKGQSVLIDTQGEEVMVGDIFFVIDLSGNKKAILKILKVKGNRAIGRIGKGSPQVGMSLERKNARQSSRPMQNDVQPMEDSYSSSYDDGYAPTSTRRWGGLLGLGMDSLSADEKNAAGAKTGNTISTSGMSFSLMGLYDHKVLSKVWFRGLFGAEGFKTSGSSSAGDRSVDLIYLGANAIARYLFSEGNIQPWLGGGFSLLFPLSKTSNLLDSSSITNTYSLLFTGGLDWKVSPRLFVPISLEYGMLPKSDSVEASWIQVRAGISIPF